MQRYVMTLARWIASKAVRAEWQTMGRQPKIGEVAKATNVYFMEHRKELLKEAWEHPVALEYRHKGRMITEFRKDRWVKSISPEDLQKLFEDYLEEYPEDRVVKTKVCF